MLEVRNIIKSFGASLVLDDVSFNVPDKGFLSLVGASGCGKTTMLRIICGLTEQDRGDVLLDGSTGTAANHKMSFVFQDINLLPWRSVVRNVEIGLETSDIGRKERRRRALEMLEMVGLADVAEDPPYNLSGGMQQRVGVARALAVQPKVLLMDEPFGQLDNFTRESLQDEVVRLWRAVGMTIVFVTHDVDEAVYLSDRILLMGSSPGRILDVIDVEYPRPRSRGAPAALSLRERIMTQLGMRDNGP